MTPKSPLDDPEYAQFAWARYRKMLRMMAWVALALVILADTWFFMAYGLISIHFYIAISLGIGLSVMFMAALMGLVFLSNGTGHDASIDNVIDKEYDHEQQ